MLIQENIQIAICDKPKSELEDRNSQKEPPDLQQILLRADTEQMLDRSIDRC